MNEVHIPTLSGSVNVIAVEINSVAEPITYKSILTQVGGAEPTEVVVKDTIPNLYVQPTVKKIVGSDFIYRLESLAGLDIPVATREVTFGATQLLGVNVNLLTNNDPSFVEFGTFDGAGLGVPNALNGTVFQVQYPSTVLQSTTEEVFNAILLKLDLVQQGLWSKIVVRNTVDNFPLPSEETITEVDGKTYRRTFSFADSSKAVRS